MTGAAAIDVRSTSDDVDTPPKHAAPANVRWRRDYARRLRLSDFIVIAVVVYGTQFAWLRSQPEITVREIGGQVSLSYTAFSAVLILIWHWALELIDSRSDRVIGLGATEFIRVTDASLRVFGTVAIGAFLLTAEVARGYLLISLPLGVLALLTERWLWRKWLIRRRRRGEFSARVLLVGSLQSVTHTAAEFRRSPEAGYFVVGACIPSGRVADVISGTNIPIMGSVDSVGRAIKVTHADTVAITSTDTLPADKVKEISWSLEAGQQHLVLAPSIADIAGPRIHTRPVSGLPLIHVETPRFSAGQRVAKRVFDLVSAGVLTAVLSPVLLILALLIRLSGPGKVLYRQERIGLRGRPFHMLKFRSMRHGADKELAKLLEAQGTAQTPLFKVQDDPRITPIGRVLRKYSLDELPQLLNVLGGSMSLVGPRPQIAAEVALYDDAAHRRLLTRPGITGLWQVSGRSSLSWEDAVRLDLYYVENWSLIGDIGILLKTGKVVVSPGASAH